eukprot:3506246-Pyramimonas_sp.AAC.1
MGAWCALVVPSASSCSVAALVAGWCQESSILQTRAPDLFRSSGVLSSFVACLQLELSRGIQDRVFSVD